MAKKFYVVWQGRETGIFTDWNTCKKHVDKFAGARYKSFTSQSEAKAAFDKENSSSPTSTEPLPSSPKSPAPKKATSSQGIKTYSPAEVAALAMDTKIFTDGGCDPNPGKAGSGIAVYRNEQLDELWFGLFNPQGTNNTAELNALHQALIMANKEIIQGRSVAIFCDSQYSIQCITQWAVGWEKKGWTKKSGEIKNLELIKTMFALHQQLKDSVQILHVNGHVGVEGNELADRMSILAIKARDKDFTKYSEKLDIPAILAMQAG